MEKAIKKIKNTSKLSSKVKLKTKMTISQAKTMKPNMTKATSPLSLDTINLSGAVHKLDNTVENLDDKFPILKNDELIKKILNVSMTNNQKGRIRQLLKDNLKGTSEQLLPQVIHNQMQSILKNSSNLTDAELRRLRILHNMLKTTIMNQKSVTQKVLDKKINEQGDKINKKIEFNIKKEGAVEPPKKVKVEAETIVKKKGPKRYVVFLGNLPLDIDKEKIMNHFAGLSDFIKDIRVPPLKEDKKSAIAYVEMKDEPSYEMALSKHHSMLGSKRINVLYTLQKKSKITKTEAKGKSAKLQALQKTGKLLGSTPLNRRRSQRRKKMKEARLKQAKDA